MFTGLVETVGTILASEKSVTGKSIRLVVDGAGLPDFDCKVGDSVAVNGCCLTVVAAENLKSRHLAFDVSTETLQKTNLGSLRVSSQVNLERAVKLGDRIGGHLVSGHVDGLATLVSFDPSADGALLKIRVPAVVAKYCIKKGSACLDGVSLTINDLIDAPDHSSLSFMIIPETMRKTALGQMKAPWQFNLEVDMMAKFAERLSITHDE